MPKWDAQVFAGWPKPKSEPCPKPKPKPKSAHHRLLLDGEEMQQNSQWGTKPDHPGGESDKFVFKIGTCANNFPFNPPRTFDFQKGEITTVKFWQRALTGAEIQAITNGGKGPARPQFEAPSLKMRSTPPAEGPAGR